MRCKVYSVGFSDGFIWTPPQCTVNIDHAAGALKTSQDSNAFNAPRVSVTDVHPTESGVQINKLVTFNDVFQIILAFQGQAYPFGCPADPCQNNIAVPCP